LNLFELLLALLELVTRFEFQMNFPSFFLLTGV